MSFEASSLRERMTLLMLLYIGFGFTVLGAFRFKIANLIYRLMNLKIIIKK